jgi:hypothetical protein
MHVTNKSLATLLIGISVAVFASQASADPISTHRAAAIKKCSLRANAQSGPSGDTTLRRTNHAEYAACMANEGEAP